MIVLTFPVHHLTGRESENFWGFLGVESVGMGYGVGVGRRWPGWLLLMVLERGVVVHERYFVQASMWVPLKFKIPGIECRVASLAITLPKWVVSEAGAATSTTMDLRANRHTHTHTDSSGPPAP